MSVSRTRRRARACLVAGLVAAVVGSLLAVASPAAAGADCTGGPTPALRGTVTCSFTNGVGDSAESDAATAVTPVTTPQAPAGVTLTPSDSSVGVWFQQPAGGGSPITGYQVTTDGEAGWHTLETTSTSGSVAGTVSGLSNGAAYQVMVRAVNAAGPGAASAQQRVVPRTVPGPPGEVRVTAGDTTATVSFTPPRSDGGATVSTYEYSVDDGGAWHEMGTTTSGSRLTGVVRGLRNGTTCPVRVRAVNAVGDGDATDPVRTTPVSPTAAAGWFRDPLGPGRRTHLSPVPADPDTVRGTMRHTRALHRTQGGRLAVPPATVRGHQLTRPQAVQVQRLFRFDSASLSANGRHRLWMLAASMRDVHAVTCEGYTDYAGTRRHHRALSRRRAVTVCRALHRFTGVRTHASGYGAGRPVVIAGRQKSRVENRRVDIVVTR